MKQLALEAHRMNTRFHPGQYQLAALGRDAFSV
jgi:hypothetical protein